MATPAAGLAIIHANRLTTLRDLLVYWMREHPLAPLEDEQVLVQSNGIAQWLRLALAQPPEQGGCGIAAGLGIDLPSAFLWRIYRQVLGAEQVPPQGPYDKPRLQWRLMRLLPELLQRDEFATLTHYLRQDPGERKLYQLAERLADLFDQYQVYRADWLGDWSAGLEQLRGADGEVRPLPADQRWQALLWRAIRADLGAQQGLSRADLHQRFLQCCLAPGAQFDGLPPRVMVFGISALPQQMIEALAALARHVQVIVAVQNPCRHYWADLIEGRELLRAARKRQALRPGLEQVEIEQLHLHAPPLLAAWGKQGRDYIRLLDQFDDSERYRHWFSDSRIDLFDEPVAEIAELPLLQQLQQDILELNPPPEAPRVLAVEEDTLQFHIAHSPQREVEILQDQILARLQQDPTLQPRDLIVMVPDIAIYQPHIDAVFGRLERDDPRYIPYSVSDQQNRGRAPLLVALEQLLQLPESRLGVSELIDLLEVPALQQRYGLEAADIPTLQRWIGGAGIRWGLDAEQRAGLDLPVGLEQNSWLFGLRRMLMGYAVGGALAPGAEPFAGIEPYDEVAGLEAALAGALALFLDHLRALQQRLRQAATPGQWFEHLSWLLQTLFTPPDRAPLADEDLLLLERLHTGLQQWHDDCQSAELETPLPLAVVREAWLGAIDQRGLAQRFLGGSLTFSTLMPMRAIPFRQIFLLGMNDGDYPRQQPPQDFDLMAGQYRPGDRSRREDDRYLFLEALLAASERLYISWIGRSIRDNQPLPPSVLVAQLRDLLEQGWRVGADPDGRRVLERLTCEHPLQPFSPRYFAVDRDPRLFTYAGEWRQVHAATERVAEQALEPLAPAGGETVLSLTQLSRFLRYPVRTFFAERLNVRFEGLEEALPEHEPFSFDTLECFQLGQQLIATARAESDQEAALAQQIARWRRAGELPPGNWADLALAQPVLSPVRATLRHLQALNEWQALPGAVEIALELSLPGQPTRLDDWLAGLHRRDGEDGESREYALIRTSPLAVTDKGAPRWHRLLELWCQHLAANAQGYPTRSYLVGPDASVLLPPMTGGAALDCLRTLAAAWHEALLAPPPLACKTGFALLTDQDKAEQVYSGNQRIVGECQTDAALARAWPEYGLLAEAGLSAWAQRLYGPLCAQAVVVGGSGA